MMTSPGLALLREALLSSNLVTETQWDNALKVAHIRKTSLEQIFIEMGIFEASQLNEISEILYGIPRMAVDPDSITVDCLQAVPRELADRYRAVPLLLSGERRLTVGLVDPTDVDAVDALSYKLQKDLRVVWISEEDYQRVLRLYDGPTAPLNVQRILDDIRVQEQMPNAVTFSDDEENVELLRALAEEAPVVRLANVLLSQAVAQRASDVHLEPGRQGARVRIRVDGSLQTMMNLPTSVYPALISRLKLISHLDITERRLPQDGRYSCTVDRRTVDMRIATSPSLFGEKVVIRLIDAGAQLQRLTDLGYSQANYERIQHLLSQPYGMILVTGPTGSGKSTTLYTALDLLNTQDRNIQTIEDPIERQIDGICQVQAHPGIGLTFSRVLRSFLRQDPDVLMVGEIRDEETAQISVQAAMTGHLLLSSLHTNDAVGTVTRLLDMGVPSYKVASALRGVTAQRLVRRLCSECSEIRPITAEDAALLADLPEPPSMLRYSTGCAACNQSGYRGRTVISEVLVVTPRLARAIAEGEHGERLLDLAKSQGMISMYEDALHKVMAGHTSTQELARMTMAVED